MRRWLHSATTGSSYDDIYKIRRADGQYRWIQSIGEPFYDADGRIAHWYGLIIDIDDRKRAEQELRRSEARKATILDSALDCIVSIDREGCITEFNPAAERTFGYRRDEVVGRELADVIIPPAFRERHRQGFARYLATGEARVLGKRIEMTALSEGRRRVVAVRNGPLEIFKTLLVLADIAKQPSLLEDRFRVVEDPHHAQRGHARRHVRRPAVQPGHEVVVPDAHLVAQKA